MANSGKKIMLIALGGAGCKIMRQIVADNAAENLDLLAIDTDIESLNISGLPSEKLIQAGKQWRAGRGCGGDELAGQRSVASERQLIEKVLEGTDLVIIVGGLGGGTCTGGLPVILGVTGKLRITTVLLVSLPFYMEGYCRWQLADKKIVSDLLPMADAVIALPNDQVFSALPPETPLSQAFELADREMARSALALAAVAGAGNLFSADIASIGALFKRHATSCALGTGRVDLAEKGIEQAISQLLTSPLLGGPEELTKADAVIFTVLGGPELSLSDAKTALSLAGDQLEPSADRTVLLGAATSPAWSGMMQITAIAVRYAVSEKLPQTAKKQSKRSAGNIIRSVRGEASEVVQAELPLLAESKGIMENTLTVIYNEEDLDVPTFKRRNMIIETL